MPKKPEVIRIRTGLPVNAWLIRDHGSVLVDCSMYGRSHIIEREMARHGVKPGDLRLILLTHTHADHAGAAAALRASTGAPIAVHRADQNWLQKGEVVIPAAVTRWGSVMSWMTRRLFLPFIHFPPAEIDVLLTDEDFDLGPYGVQGVVRSTPGHTAGSVSVLLPGSAVVGDMAMNGFPFRRGPGLPLAADDLPRLLESWRSLLETHQFDVVYPGHGAPFPANVMRRQVYGSSPKRDASGNP